MFIAQTYRDILKDRPATNENLSGIRRLLTQSIHTMDFNALMRIFRAIASGVNPIPFPQESAVQHKYATPNKYRRRREDNVVILSLDIQSREIPIYCEV